MRHMIILINLVIAYFYYMQRRANVKSQGKNFIFTSKYTFPPDMRSRAPRFSKVLLHVNKNGSAEAEPLKAYLSGKISAC